MNKTGLPTYWIRWRRRRYQSLFVQGLAGHLAWDVAAAEAKHRHRVSKLIGRDAARDARFIAIGDRFVLTGVTMGLTDRQVAAIEALNSRAMPKAA